MRSMHCLSLLAAAVAVVCDGMRRSSLQDYSDAAFVWCRCMKPPFKGIGLTTIHSETMAKQMCKESLRPIECIEVRGFDCGTFEPGLGWNGCWWRGNRDRLCSPEDRGDLYKRPEDRWRLDPTFCQDLKGIHLIPPRDTWGSTTTAPQVPKAAMPEMPFRYNQSSSSTPPGEPVRNNDGRPYGGQTPTTTPSDPGPVNAKGLTPEGLPPKGPRPAEAANEGDAKRREALWNLRFKAHQDPTPLEARQRFKLLNLLLHPDKLGNDSGTKELLLIRKAQATLQELKQWSD